jgi:hypothetical protein
MRRNSQCIICWGWTSGFVRRPALPASTTRFWAFAESKVPLGEGAFPLVEAFAESRRALSADMCREVHIALGEGFFLNQNEKKTPFSGPTAQASPPSATCTTAAAQHHQKRERDTERDIERERSSQGRSRRGGALRSASVRPRVPPPMTDLRVAAAGRGRQLDKETRRRWSDEETGPDPPPSHLAPPPLLATR